MTVIGKNNKKAKEAWKMNSYKEVKKKGKKGVFITLGALMAFGAVTLYNKGKGLVTKIGDKMKSIGN